MKINKIFAILALGTLLITSCNDDKFLEEKSYQHDSETFYTSQRAMEIGLAACYAEVQYVIYGCMRTTHSWMLMGCNLDTFTETSATGNVNWGSMGPNSGYARHWADYMYKLANRANTVIDGIDKHPEIVYKDDKYKNELRAEAVFMRAFAYRVLAGMYGGVVYNEHRTTEARYDYELISREAAWAKIKEDFAWAEQNLPKTPRMKGTVTKAAAAHYLAEVCLALGDFAGARDAATRVIDKTDGDYNLMTTRFGNRKEQMTDRYGNSLAAPQGAYWDLFRSSAKTNGVLTNGVYENYNTTTDGNSNDPDNKEAIWVCQSDFSSKDLWTQGGSGDSWWRTHTAPVEACWAPWFPMGGKTGVRKDKDGVSFYVFTTDAVCYPAGVTVAGADKPDANVADATGRQRAYGASCRIDSLACRSQGNGAQYGLTCIATEYIQRPYGDINGSVWDDPNDFRGSEVMIQRNPYGPTGKSWSEIKADIAARAAAHPGDSKYQLTANDTMNITPRFWKFSDDVHPFHDNPLGDTYVKDNVYDCDWYMIRIAETYLLRAEAYLGLNDKPKARADIKVIRDRAGAATPDASQIDIDYIMDERARELFGEEHRWITLNRLTCNPKATYVTAKYPTQNTTTTNYMYERVHKYGFGFEGAPGSREAYTDAMGKASILWRG